MAYAQAQQPPAIMRFLQRVAPYSVLDKGIKEANDGLVSDLWRDGGTITGSIKESGSSTRTSLRIAGIRNISASCSCSSAEDMQEQWCSHAVALLWSASAAGLFVLDEPALTEQFAPGSPQDIAATLRDLHAIGGVAEPCSELKVILRPERDFVALYCQLEPDVQRSLSAEKLSTAELALSDRLLVRLLRDHAEWDDENNEWHLSSKEEFDIFFTLLGQRSFAPLLEQGGELIVKREALQARVVLTWRANGVELTTKWLTEVNKELVAPTLLGRDHSWALAEGSVYPVGEGARRIAALFARTPTIFWDRRALAPILEVLEQGEAACELIEIHREDLRPASARRSPKPILTFSQLQGDSTLPAKVDFSYPASPGNKNLVYLPDRKRENEFISFLISLGFSYDSAKKSLVICGDRAINLLHSGEEVFPSPWEVRGLKEVRAHLHFAELDLKVDLSRSSEHSGMFDCTVRLCQNNSQLPLRKVFQNIPSGCDQWTRLDSGALARIPAGGANSLTGVIGPIDANFRHAGAIRSKISMAQAISLSRLAESGAAVSADEMLTEVLGRLRQFQGIESGEASPNFRGSLRSYQKEGVSWLKFLSDFGLCGILADEMGLGKTVQALAFIQMQLDATRSTKQHRPALVVAPTSVINNWLHESRRFCPKLRALLLHGPQRRQLFAQIAHSDLVITSYALLRTDRAFLTRQRFSSIFLDEAQNIKNPESATAQAAKELHSDSRFALTGTPTENRPLELWSIFDFLMPGYLGTVGFFRRHIERPIMESGGDNQVLQQLQQRTRPFIMRRLKRDVEKELPPKHESEMFVEMTPAQSDLYRSLLEEVRPQVFKAVDQRGIGGASISILSALLRLRQVCNHPLSLYPEGDFALEDSGKLTLLQELVHEALDSGHKILLFSQFLEMLAIIRRWLTAEQISHLYLDGATKRRQELVDRFNNDPSVRLFLISLKAGGSGINLAGADTVLIYDPWWNPAVEAQAVDRAHRIGQNKPVNVYRLVTENSIEAKIMKLKLRKAALVEALIDEGSMSNLALTRADLEKLFS